MTPNVPQPPRELDREACFEAFLAHDPRFDGRFFVSNKLTGIYCRPICRAHFSRPDNFDFHLSAAAAEAKGYRPCLKCRPEIAPGLSPAEAGPRLARRAALLIERDFLFESSLADLARSLGLTSRHLRRVFDAEFGVSPVQYLQTRKLLLAKNLLTDTNLPITQIAFAAGFSSLRRFNDLFKQRYRLAPSSFKKDNTSLKKTLDGATLLLAYRPPYQWPSILEFLAGRAMAGVEEVADNSYRRVVRIQDSATYYGWIKVSDRPEKKALAVTVAPGLLPVLPRVLARVRTLFDTDCDPCRIYDKLRVMNEFVKPGACLPGTRLPGAFDPFEMAVRAILGQQITVKAARTLAGRLTRTLGTPVTTPFAELTHAFPQPRDLLSLGKPIADHLGPLGITGARCRSILALASAIELEHIHLDMTADPEQMMERLLELPGFGPWTAQYVAMRALSYPDAFPHTDYGLKKALAPRPAREVAALSEQWRPWRSYAAINLWNSLNH
ncbi:MAG: helix-turn-helix domain-containing protein [Candidatus Adiutrix sp.]|jgi:AraC family transcriptional regulator of adaptative response / DNA-3-methyladenine glycosylase II|nr:helix-turn-helix domain-containing protein [Candidatus Adiutrix sp.]